MLLGYKIAGFSIVALLGVIGFILSIILTVGIYFYKRTKSLNKSRANVW